MLVPIILGSDKTTVSVATGQNEYYPLYLSIGNVHNTIRRAHRGPVAVIAFLPDPKGSSFCLRQWVLMRNLAGLGEKQDSDCAKFRRFRRELFHVTLSKILESLRPGMTCPELVRCFDGHYRRAIYSIGPYIADYPEQALVACIVQGWCPRYGVVFIDRRSRSHMIHSCTAKRDNLDEGNGRRAREHTELLVATQSLSDLWERYGLVGDVTVSSLW
jgi:hypothetical protein